MLWLPLHRYILLRKTKKEGNAYHKENAIFQVCGREIVITENPRVVVLKGGNRNDGHTL